MNQRNNTALARTNAASNALSAYVPTSTDAAIKLAKYVSESGLAPRALNTPQKVFTAMAFGAELGMTPMQSLSNIHVVEGKPGLSADMLIALVRQSGAAAYFREIESTTERCTFATARADDPDHEVRRTWTMEDARRAGLTGKANWKSYPRPMLRARAGAELARAVYPEVCAGVYVPEELTDSARRQDYDPGTHQVVDVRPQQRRAPEPEVVDETTQADALGDRVAKAAAYTDTVCTANEHVCGLYTALVKRAGDAGDAEALASAKGVARVALDGIEARELLDSDALARAGKVEGVDAAHAATVLRLAAVAYMDAEHVAHAVGVIEAADVGALVDAAAFVGGVLPQDSEAVAIDALRELEHGKVEVADFDAETGEVIE